MAEIKFSCGHCGQHISCDQQWAGHEIQCPACQGLLSVPHLEVPMAPPRPNPSPSPTQSSTLSPAKLKPGVTQVTRSTAPSFSPPRNTARPPKTSNPAIKYAAVALLFGVLAIAALKFLPGLLNHAQEISAPRPSGSSAAPVSGGQGPLGEMNGAMDVSDALDGSGPSRTRPGGAPRAANAATNSAVRQKAAPQ
jgi:hypothetical protein